MSGLEEKGGQSAGAPPIMAALRETTSHVHQSLERTVDLPSRLESTPKYRALLEAFLGFYEPVEEHLRQVGELEVTGITQERLRKTEHLKSDLAAMGTTAASLALVPRCRHLPPLESVSQALGTMYVLEGATLGGQVVRREIEQRCREIPAHSFFSSYGDRVGAMWKAFGGCVTNAVQRNVGSDAIILASARATFLALERWLQSVLKS